MRERVERRTHARERVIYIIDDWGRTKPKNESVFNAASEARKMEVARDSMLSSGIASQRQPQQVHLGIGTEFLAWGARWRRCRDGARCSAETRAPRSPWHQPCFSLAIFRQKEKKIMSRNSKIKWFWSSLIARSDNNNNNISRFLYLVFSVANSIDGCLNSSSLYLVYSQIWLKFPKNDSQLFYIFLWKIVILATKEFLWRKQQSLPLLLCMGCVFLKGGRWEGGGNLVKFWQEKYDFNL